MYKPIAALTIMFFTAAVCKAQLHLSVVYKPVKFNWLSDTINQTTEPNAAMLVPVKLKGCPAVFYMQFDLGSPLSFFYKEKLNDILAKYPLTDTGTFYITKSNNKKREIIGTIGEDLVNNKTLVIDYPGQTLLIDTMLTGKLRGKVALNDFMLAQGRILLPASVNDKPGILFFDTGSSAFYLLTSKATSDQLAVPNAITESYPVNSWGKTLIANTRPTSDSIALASLKLPIKKVTYIDGASNSQVQQMLKLGISGMIGNKLFLGSTLIIDTKNKKFGVIQH